MEDNPPHKINWHEIKLKKYILLTQGTHDLRFLVQRLHEAQHNLSL